MSNASIENRDSIKRRLWSEATRQWGYGEQEVSEEAFDPLVDLLMGAFSVEAEKLWHEVTQAKSRVVKQLIENILPEVATGILPAHAVCFIQPPPGETAELPVTDQFFVPGVEESWLTPAGSFRMTTAQVKLVAGGQSIELLNAATGRRETFVQLTGARSLPSHTLWIGLQLPTSSVPMERIPLFINWLSELDRARYLPYTVSLRFLDSTGKSLSASSGLGGMDESKEVPISFLSEHAHEILGFYEPHYYTLDVPWGDRSQIKKYPLVWNDILEDQEKVLLDEPLFWVEIKCPPAYTPDALSKMQILTNCFPMMNRRLVRQRGRIQPLFNVYALSDETDFLAIEKVLDGDGKALLPAQEISQDKGRGTYLLRNRTVARFDRRDAFEKLTDVVHHLRDDLAAINALDNSLLTPHLEIVARSVAKLKESMSTLDSQLPKIYLMANSRVGGGMLDVHYWTSPGAKGNGISAGTQLTAESSNQTQTSGGVLLVPTTGGRAPLNEEETRKAFREALLTRGRAVSREDFRILAKKVTGQAASSIQVRKALSVGQGVREGVVNTLEVTLTPDSRQSFPESFWLGMAQQVKNQLVQRSANVLPLYVQVEGYTWKL